MCYSIQELFYCSILRTLVHNTEGLLIAEFAVNNKIHSATKMFLFIANHGRELRMGADIRKKGKVEKVMEFVERIKKV